MLSVPNTLAIRLKVVLVPSEKPRSSRQTNEHTNQN